MKEGYLAFAESIAANRKFGMTEEKRETMRAFRRANTPAYQSR